MRYSLIIIMMIVFLSSCQTTQTQIHCFNGLIDDFENDLSYWKEKNSQISKNEINNNCYCVFKFEAVFTPEEYTDKISSIKYIRKMNFKNYKGIKFLAKSDIRDIIFKIKIHEEEEYFNPNRTEEIWYTRFKVKPSWSEYKISFRDMDVEEYYEQNYMSDNKQNFTNISGIEISVQNFAKTDTIVGELYLDNITLY